MGISNVELIRSELEELSGNGNVDTGLFRIRSANLTLAEASMRPDPLPLWLSLWYESEVCILFADSNLGKSIYAIQIATEIAKQQKVILFDFELSDKQFQVRYTDDTTGELYTFPEGFFRGEINQDALLNIDDNFEEAIIRNIETTIIQTGAKVAIVDNISYLCSASEKGDVAAILMMKLIQLKRKHNLSMLVLAHTPKRPLSSPITQNDLAGSKKLINFCDSAFAIGKSAKDENLRYIKQIKVRHGSFAYDAENVIVTSIEKQGAFLMFETLGYSTEAEHLKEPSEEDKQMLVGDVKRLRLEGKSIRTIAAELGMSKSKIDRLLK